MKREHKTVASGKNSKGKTARSGVGHTSEDVAAREPTSEASFEYEFQVPLAVEICVKDETLCKDFMYADGEEAASLCFDSLESVTDWLHALADTAPYDAEYRAHVHAFADRLKKEGPALVARVQQRKAETAKKRNPTTEPRGG